MMRAYPDAPLYTALYEPDLTFPDFKEADIRTLPLDRMRAFRKDHRLALPLLAPAFSALTVDADVVLCSSSGWAHGVRARGLKLVYCHTPARWLYQEARYLRGRPRREGAVLKILQGTLRRWDQRAARSADRYFTQSTAVRDRIRQVYDLDAELLPAPYALEPSGQVESLPGLPTAFYLCVSRLLPYKN